MKLIKRWRTLALILLVVCLCSSFLSVSGGHSGESAGDDDEIVSLTDDRQDGMKCAAKNERYSLWVTDSGEFAGEFRMLDNKDGLSWFSNPPDKAADKTSKGSPRFEMFSQIILYGFDSATNGEKTVNSYIGAQKGRGVTVTAIENGFRTVYRFENEKVELSIYVTLSGDYLEIRCPLEEMKENGSYRVVKIAVAPYYGSGGQDDEGYLVVPDGSGALIRFNNMKTNAAPYSVMLYGDNPSLADERKLKNTQTAALPVFGINRNQVGFLGVVSEGDAETELKAFVSGQRNSRNTAYANFVVRNVDTVIIGESGLSETKEVVRYDFEHKNMKACAVRYYPLEKGMYTYADMAVRYRHLLLEQRGESVVSTKDSLFFAELYAGVIRSKTYFGLTLQKYDPLTDIRRAEEIRDELLNEGIGGTTVLYRNWSKDEAAFKLQNKVRPATGIGSNKELKVLVGNSVYLSFSPLTVRKNGNGFWTFLDASKRMSKEPALLYTYKLSTHYKDSESKPGYLPTLKKLSDTIEKFGNSAKKYGVDNVYLTDAGSMLYTNFDQKKYASREELMEKILASCRNLGESLAVRNPNGYMLPITDMAVNLPTECSWYDVEDSAIPFYQIALSGVIPYSCEAVNLSSNPRRMILKCIESASGLYFSWIGENGSDIKETTLNTLYGADYSRWKDFAIAAQKELDDVFRALGTRVIRTHETLANQVTRTVFENGKTVLVNYTDQPVETTFGTVPANSYLVV